MANMNVSLDKREKAEEEQPCCLYNKTGLNGSFCNSSIFRVTEVASLSCLMTSLSLTLYVHGYECVHLLFNHAM